MEPAVTVRDVSKTFRVYKERNQSLKATVLRGGRARYEEFWALQDVSFDVAAGQTTGLMGRNGSGKSTLLKCIAGILRPTSGRITTSGRVAAMLEVGSGFHPELSGRENVYLNGAILGMTKQEVDRKLESIIDFSGVERFIDHPVKNYSSGMYVRLGFSVAIHTEPDVLLVDEVLAVGDMDFQEKCKDRFAMLKRDGKTVVVVSHDTNTMRTFCDQAAWLEDGRLRDLGEASTIVDRYADATHATHEIEGGGQRYGSGQVLFDEASFVDDQGRRLDEVDSRAPLTLRLRYTATERVLRPSFSASINSAGGGMSLWWMVGAEAGFLPEAIEPGSGFVDIAIDQLPLGQGQYEINVDVREPDEALPIDNVRAMSTFGVERRELAGRPSLLAVDARFARFETGRA